MKKLIILTFFLFTSTFSYGIGISDFSGLNTKKCQNTSAENSLPEQPDFNRHYLSGFSFSDSKELKCEKSVEVDNSNSIVEFISNILVKVTKGILEAFFSILK